MRLQPLARAARAVPRRPAARRALARGDQHRLRAYGGSNVGNFGGVEPSTSAVAGPAVLGRADAAAARRRLARPRGANDVVQLGRRCRPRPAERTCPRVGAERGERRRPGSDPRARSSDGFFAATLALRPATSTASVSAGSDLLTVVTKAIRRPVLARAAGRAARAVARPRPTRLPLDGGARSPSRSSELVIYELHVGTFTPEGTFDARDPAPRRELARARGDRDRADAGRDVPRRARLGLRRRAHVRAAPRLRRARTASRASSTPRTRAASPCSSTSSTTTSAPARSCSPRSARTSPTATTRSGATRSTTRSAACASGRSRTPSSGCATTGSTGSGSTPRTRSSTSRAPHVMASSPSACAQRTRRALVIAEMEIGDRRPIEEWGHDAQWADELHHALHVLLTGEREATTRTSARSPTSAARPTTDDASVSSSARRTTTRSATARSATGCRRRRRRLAAACTLFAPQVPLLFMGEEYGETAPVPVLHRPRRSRDRRSDARGPQAGVREVRGASAARVPDPQARATFERSKLHPEAGDDELRAFYAELLALRRTLPREVRRRRRRDAPRPARAPWRASSSSPTSRT